MRFCHFILLAGLLCTAGSLALRFRAASPFDKQALLASYTYLGPKSPLQGDPQLIQVQVLVKDSLQSDGPVITQAEFNKQNIPLQPRDIYGNRGSASFQLSPGKYSLRWTINQHKTAWPRTISHEEEVTLSPRDLWLQIVIEGEKASIE